MRFNTQKSIYIFLVISLVFSCILIHGYSYAISDGNTLLNKNTNEFERFVLVIDPAHGGRDMGSKGVNLSEKTFSFKVAKFLKNKISKYKKIKVVLTRDTDKELTNSQRTGIANFNNADLFLSIHADSSWRVGDRGPTVFVSSPQRPARLKGESQIAVSYRWERGQNVHLVRSIRFAKGLLKRFDRIDKKKKTKFHLFPLRILEGARMPALYISMGVISSPEDEARLLEIGEDNSYIESIVLEVLSFFRISR
ncbi:MAG: N-acetylmuramoyl-L-alanine amidase [Nitrospinota bacterium]|nr:N-acetylmuramoyl-L-alanine amidase [Nitrospinota bacterium]